MALWMALTAATWLHNKTARKELKLTRGSSQTLIILHVPFNSAYYFCLHFFYRIFFFCFSEHFFSSFSSSSWCVAVQQSCPNLLAEFTHIKRMKNANNNNNTTSNKNERHVQNAKMYNIFPFGIVSLAQLHNTRKDILQFRIFLFSNRNSV